MEQEQKTISGQIRAARGILDISQSQLASAAGVSSMTIKRAEGSGSPFPSPKAIQSIFAALEAAGVHFIPENGGGAGVRLASRAQVVK